MGCLRHGCSDRKWTRGGVDSGEAPILAAQRIDYVEDRDVNNGHGPAGTPGTELFAENTVFAWSYGRVVQACRINGNLIPAVDHITRDF